MVDIKVGVEAYEQTTPATVVPTVTRITYDPNDPYDTPEEHAETSDFIFNTFFFWTGAGGTFSTWRERHVFLNGFYNGFGTPLQAVFSTVPAMWADERQYYQFGQEAGYVVRNGFIFAVAGGATTTVAMNSASIITLVRTLIGM